MCIVKLSSSEITAVSGGNGAVFIGEVVGVILAVYILKASNLAKEIPDPYACCSPQSISSRLALVFSTMFSRSNFIEVSKAVFSISVGSALFRAIGDSIEKILGINNRT